MIGFLRRALSWLGAGRKTRDGILWHCWWSLQVRWLYGKPKNRAEAAEQARAILAGFADLPTADKLIPSPRPAPKDVTGGYLIVGRATVDKPETPAIEPAESEP